MQPNVNAIERAFQLASSGKFHDVEEIRRRLKREGYGLNHIVGRLLLSQLRAAVTKAATSS